MTVFSITTPPRILFGRGEASKAASLAMAFGPRGLIVHGANASRAAPLIAATGAQGIACIAEPTLPMLESALALARPHAPDWVLAMGGGAVLDFGKALAALIPSPTPAMDHLEGVGPAHPLTAPPLPFIAIPTTSGTGAEVTKNAVIGVPDAGKKVSLRDDRMIARVAIIDPALTDNCPKAVTLASGLDAITQVIEPYISSKATPYTDAITLPAISAGLPALMRLMETEDAAARDTMAWVSLTGGLALANAGLGAVHGFAGVVGGMTGAAHGAICGALLPHVIAMNRARVADPARLDWVCKVLGQQLGTTADAAPMALADWSRAQGLPSLTALGLRESDHAQVVSVAQTASSMKANPVVLAPDDLLFVLRSA
ncbi:MAG: iron-containing alcohol dehydrogenase [Rhodobacteraceae bacterium]|nr:iron-containing alcohol dehydrogenase [Paracoccaceae bacterium]